MKTKVLGLLAVGMLAGPMASNAEMMTFGDGTELGIKGYIESGLQIQSDAAFDFEWIRDWPTTNSNGESIPGERELTFLSESLRFSLESDGTFDLLSLDVEDPGSNWANFGEFVVTGSNGSFVTVSGTNFVTTTFGSGFAGLSWFTLSCSHCQATVDNISFRLNGTSVPEPGTLALLGLGLAGLGLSRRRRAD